MLQGYLAPLIRELIVIDHKSTKTRGAKFFFVRYIVKIPIIKEKSHDNDKRFTAIFRTGGWKVGRYPVGVIRRGSAGSQRSQKPICARKWLWPISARAQAIWLPDWRRWWEVHVIDGSAKMLEVARQNLNQFKNVEYHLADGDLSHCLMAAWMRSLPICTCTTALIRWVR